MWNWLIDTWTVVNRWDCAFNLKIFFSLKHVFVRRSVCVCVSEWAQWRARLCALKTLKNLTAIDQHMYACVCVCTIYECETGTHDSCCCCFFFFFFFHLQLLIFNHQVGRLTGLSRCLWSWCCCLPKYVIVLKMCLCCYVYLCTYIHVLWLNLSVVSVYGVADDVAFTVRCVFHFFLPFKRIIILKNAKVRPKHTHAHTIFFDSS